MTRHAAKSAEGRVDLIDIVVARHFSARLCEQLIDKEIPFSNDDLTAMATLRDDADPEFRLVAIRKVLAHPNMDTKTAIEAARSMLHDGDADVRDAAYSILDSAQHRG